MDFHIIRCPLQHSKIIMLGTFRTIKCHFGGFLNPTPHFIPHLFYLRLMFLGSVRSPLHLKHLKPFGTLATIKPHLAPSLIIMRTGPKGIYIIILSRTEEPVKAGTCVHDRHVLQQLALNVHVKHFDMDLRT